MLEIHRGWYQLADRREADKVAPSASFIITAMVGHRPDILLPPPRDIPLLSAAWGDDPSVILHIAGRDIPLAYETLPVERLPAAHDRNEPLPCMRITLSALSTADATLETSEDATALAAVRNILPDLDVIFYAKPWFEPWRSDDLVRAGRRTIYLGGLGEYGGHWHDGPILHIRPDGDVASFLPSGGNASLRIPTTLNPGTGGVPLAQALALDNSTDEAVHRCLLARVDAHLRSQESAALTLRTENLSLVTACCIVLIRQARPAIQISIQLPACPDATQRGPWRRFGQNTGVRIEDTPVARAHAPAATLPIFLLDERWALPLARSINHISDVIPRSLWP